MTKFNENGRYHFSPPNADHDEFPPYYLAIVESCDPYRGLCRIRGITVDCEGDCPYMSPFAGMSGTPETDDDEAYYKQEKHGSLKHKDPRMMTEGMLYSIPERSLVVVMNSGQSLAAGVSNLHVIVGCLSMTQWEFLQSGPDFSGDTANPLGNPYIGGAIKKRILNNKDDILDEVGTSSDDRDALNKNEQGALMRTIPMMPSDTFWGVWKKARKRKMTPTVRKRLAYDKARLVAKYHIGGLTDILQSATDLVESLVGNLTGFQSSEAVVHIDKQGRILIGTELSGTLAKVFSDQKLDYVHGNEVDAGNFLAMGTSEGISYLEISSREWLFMRFKDGITKFDGDWRVHGHAHGIPHRIGFDLNPIALFGGAFTPAVAENLALNNPLISGSTYYHESDNVVFNTKRFVVNADVVEIHSKIATHMNMNPAVSTLGFVNVATMVINHT